MIWLIWPRCSKLTNVGFSPMLDQASYHTLLGSIPKSLLSFGGGEASQPSLLSTKTNHQDPVQNQFSKYYVWISVIIYYSTQCLLDTLSLRNSPPCWCKYHCGLCHRIWRERHKVYSVSHLYHRLWLDDKYLHALLMYFPQHQIWNPPIEIISMRDIVS